MAVGQQTTNVSSTSGLPFAKPVKTSWVRGLLAHLILVPAWTLPPPLLLLSCIGCGHGLGLPGSLFGVGTMAVLLGGPRGAVFRFGLWLADLAMALSAPPEKRPLALVCAGVLAVMLYPITCKKWSQSPSFYKLITETLDGRAYYKKIEVRGALDEITPGKNFVAAHPHGCLSAGWTWNVFWNECLHARTGRIGYFIDDGLRYKTPSFRIVCDAYEGPDRFCEAATRKNLKAAMAKGESISLIPGGFQDATVYENGKERTCMRDRKGFIKYCLEAGYKVIPVYTFGESELFYTATPFLKFRLWLNKFNIPAVMFCGNPLIPFLPRSDVPVITCFGSPIQFPTIAEPTPADVNEWHNTYVEALRATFDKHKAECGKPNAKLEIW